MLQRLYVREPRHSGFRTIIIFHFNATVSIYRDEITCCSHCPPTAQTTLSSVSLPPLCTLETVSVHHIRYCTFPRLPLVMMFMIQLYDTASDCSMGWSPWEAASSSTGQQISAFHVNPKFIVLLTTDRHFSPSCARCVHSTTSHFIYLKYIVLSYHLRLDLQSELLYTIACIEVSVLSICATCPAHLLPPTYQYPVTSTNNTNQ
jgi:hypothetical protein